MGGIREQSQNRFGQRPPKDTIHQQGTRRGARRGNQHRRRQHGIYRPHVFSRCLCHPPPPFEKDAHFFRRGHRCSPIPFRRVERLRSHRRRSPVASLGKRIGVPRYQSGHLVVRQVVVRGLQRCTPHQPHLGKHRLRRAAPTPLQFYGGKDHPGSRKNELHPRGTTEIHG